MRYLSVLFFLALFSGTSSGKTPITIYLAGDSTMAEKTPDKRPETGWGEMLQKYFKVAQVKVENHAKNGRSTRSFIEEKRWQTIVEKLRAGDYVFIQFGHNDQKENSDRYASPADYGKNLIRFINEVRDKKAIPILLTPVMRRRFDSNGVFQDTHGEYPNAVRAVAREHQVALIDMHRQSEAVIKRYGIEESKKLFLQLKAGEHPNYPNGVEDNTHFSPLGADEMAKLVITSIRQLKLDLSRYLKKASEANQTK
ncbi:MAG: rhamnogalacturonan acetylesterase [Acidobacteriota bacterium]